MSIANTHSASLQPAIQLHDDPASWDQYVHRAPTASIYHLWAWRRAIEDSFGHRCCYLTASVPGKLAGILPLVEMKSRWFGHFLVSLPYFNYGGLVVDSPEIANRLLMAAGDLANSLGAKHVELRQGAPAELAWPGVAPKVAMLVPLPPSGEQYWKSLSSRLRNKVKHAEKHGLECRWGGAEMVPQFYSVFAENMRNLGTPVYPRVWFENIMRLLPEHTRILAVSDGDTTVAATLVTRFRNAVELPWIASTPEARKHYSTVLLYWTAMSWAIENGCGTVDLGRCTPGGGTYLFKQQWNCNEFPLHWYYWLAPGAAIPHLRPDNPKYRLAVRVWQKLPLWLANRLGPSIVRSIP